MKKFFNLGSYILFIEKHKIAGEAEFIYCSTRDEYPPPGQLVELYKELMARLAPGEELAAPKDMVRNLHAQGRLPRSVGLPDGSLEYQGEIMGIHNFAKWVLSFGSSAEVIEPALLRQQMIEKVKNRASPVCKNPRGCSIFKNP